tara:strand:- start:124 stop:489 length:366 start_codon:yes stop_codon:yes gene_type:complete
MQNIAKAAGTVRLKLLISVLPNMWPGMDVICPAGRDRILELAHFILSVRWDNYAEKPSNAVEHTGVPLLGNYQFLKEKYFPPPGTISDQIKQTTPSPPSARDFPHPQRNPRLLPNVVPLPR